MHITWICEIISKFASYNFNVSLASLNKLKYHRNKLRRCDSSDFAIFYWLRFKTSSRRWLNQTTSRCIQNDHIACEKQLFIRHFFKFECDDKHFWNQTSWNKQRSLNDQAFSRLKKKNIYFWWWQYLSLDNLRTIASYHSS